jgi:HAE1 family hydrophobic/amphiphilic exporter-1/multidrug efflux pump
VNKAIMSNPFNETSIAFTGFDFAGGFVFRENAATIFVTQKHWDERPMPVGALVGEFYARPRTSRKAWRSPFPPPAIFRSSAPLAASSSTSRTAAKAGRSA